MNQSYELALSVLLGNTTTHDGLEQLLQMREQGTPYFISASSCLVRLFKTLNKWEQGQACSRDFAVHLRQFILAYKRKIYLRVELIQLISAVSQQYGFELYPDHEVDVVSTYPDWITNSNAIEDAYSLKERSVRIPAIGDGILHRLTGFTYYHSVAQKELVHAAMQMVPGETLMACLPTGGGKSLIGLIPAFFETQGGTLKGGILSSVGTTIVVVPTIALAIDQKNAAQRSFSNAVDEKYRPQAYRGDMPKQEKELIFEGIREGTIPLLFTSPESLIMGPLGDTIIKSASRGHVNRLVIDEAHIVVDWGNHFRTGFQLLSAFRKQLLECSKGKLKTIIMSATLTPWTSHVLRELFSEKDKLTEIRCDALRYEPFYMVDQVADEELRFQKIIEMLSYLPRPVILYVNTRAHADIWLQKIIEAGYTAVEKFTGDTKDLERRSLLEAWNQDNIDIMVATSAFGMGVDKPDIRTIIHCCVPESLNRYYQEVGRGGRDGFASISLLSIVKQKDFEIVHDLTDGQVLTAELLVERWSKLYETSEVGDFADERWLDMSVQPEHLLHTNSGKRNANWNVASVLLLIRHGVLELLDYKRVEEQPDIAPNIKVKILSFNVISDPGLLLPYVRPDRERERDRIIRELDKMKQYVTRPEKQCLSEFLIETYPYSNAVCGGCPHCSKKAKGLRYNQPKTEVLSRCQLKVEPENVGMLLQHYFLGSYNQLLMPISSQRWNDTSIYLTVIEALIESNVRTIVLPTLDEDLMKSLIKQAPDERQNKAYLFLQEGELMLPYAREVRGPIAVIYPVEPKLANKFYLWSQSIVRNHALNRIIHIVDPSLVISKEGKAIRDSMDHLSLPLEAFLETHQQQLPISLF